MPIEFYCDDCYQKVTTPDATAGKKGRCPHCGAILTIPMRSEKPTRPTGGAAGSPAGDTSSAAAGPAIDALNPYGVPGAELRPGDPGWRQSHARWGDFQSESKLRRLEEARFEAQRALGAPAVGMIVSAIIGMLATAGYVMLLALVILQVVISDAFEPGLLALHTLFVVVNIVINSMVIIGANHMRMTRSYTMALSGAILAFLPAPLNLTCVLAAPFGLWALLVMSRKEIRDAFKKF